MTKTPEELTKDWKEGKLKSGLYWVKFKGKIVIAECTVFGDVSRPFEIETKTDFMIKISKVLAPVPTYDEYMAMQDQIADASKKVEELELNNKILEKCQEEDFGVSYLVTVKTQRENDMFRDRLKECKKEFSDISTMACYPETHLTHPANFDELFNKCEGILTRIDAALNETQANPAADIKIQESEE